MSGGGSTQQTTTTSAPPVWLEPYLKKVVGTAGTLYDNKAGANVYGGPTVAGPSGDTRAAWDMTRDVAQSGGALGQAQDVFGNIGNIAQGGSSRQPMWSDLYRESGAMNDRNAGILANIAGNTGMNKAPNLAMDQVMRGPGITTGNQYKSLANNAGIQPDIYTAGLRDVAGRTTRDSAAERYLTDTASGGMLGSNPYAQAIADDNAERIRSQVSSAMSGAGRYGSFAHGDALTKAITSANNPMMSQLYESERGRQLQATGMIDNAEQAGWAQRAAALQAGAGIDQRALDQQLAATAGLTGVQGQNISNKMNAANMLGASNRADAGLRANAAQAGAGINQADMGIRSGLIGNMGSDARADDALQLSALGAQAGMVPTMQNLMERPGQLTAGVGGQQDARSQAQLDADRMKWEQLNNLDWTQLQRMLGPISALSGSAGGTQTQTAPGANPWMTGLGLGIAGIPALFGAPFGGTSAVNGILGMFGR